jgi:desulfoferrodoxin (superoxide reductase-like protein)
MYEFEYGIQKNLEQNYSFPEHFITNIKVQMKQQKVHQTQYKSEKKATFTYYRPKIKKLTNLFKHTNINSALKNTNTIQQYT